MAKPAFPHMGPRDVELFAAFVLTETGQEFEHWEFDTRLAKGRVPDFPASRKFSEGMRRLSQLRVDAIGWKNNRPTVIEVKPEAHLAAFGQVQAYQYFFEKERGQTARKAIITDYCNTDIRELFLAFDIKWHMVEPASLLDIRRAQAYVRSLPRR